MSTIASLVHSQSVVKTTVNLTLEPVRKGYSEFKSFGILNTAGQVDAELVA